MKQVISTEQIPMIECACGCGTIIKSIDNYGRQVKYVSGHNNRKYKDPKQHKIEWNKRNKKQRTEYKKLTRHKRKVELILYKGGKCYECGLKYNGNNGCLFDFHHINNKSFGISGNVMEKSLDKLKKEADNCILLCANCHRKKHSEEY